MWRILEADHLRLFFRAIGASNLGRAACCYCLSSLDILESLPYMISILEIQTFKVIQAKTPRSII